MYELPDNSEYLVNTILPRLQEMQRDTTRTTRLAFDIGVAADNGLITAFVTDYDPFGSIQEAATFPFFSHHEVEEIEEAYKKLEGYVKSRLG